MDAAVVAKITATVTITTMSVVRRIIIVIIIEAAYAVGWTIITIIIRVKIIEY